MNKHEHVKHPKRRILITTTGAQ